MREKIQSIDYVGFTFNGTHSSQLGIVRTSDGSRFNENLLPTIQDKTVQVPGGDGTYYFGSFYTQKPFNIQFAFDDLTEQEFAELKKWLGDKKVHELIFDETPYKAYQAKITGSATMKYIPFEEGATNRLYKGEGSVQFTAYYPYAKSTFKFLDECEATNKLEWKAASAMKETQGVYDILNDNKNQILLYNPGDIEAEFQLKIEFDETGALPKFGISLNNYSGRALSFKNISRQGYDKYIQIDSKLNLVEGYNEDGTKSGNLYNKYIIAGQFFKIPNGQEDIALIFSRPMEGHNPKIIYDYYYF